MRGECAVTLIKLHTQIHTRLTSLDFVQFMQASSGVQVPPLRPKNEKTAALVVAVFSCIHAGFPVLFTLLI